MQIKAASNVVVFRL